MGAQWLNTESHFVLFCCGWTPVNCILNLQGYITGPGQSYDCPNACELNLKNVGTLVSHISGQNWHRNNNNKTHQCGKSVPFYGIYSCLDDISPGPHLLTWIGGRNVELTISKLQRMQC